MDENKRDSFWHTDLADLQKQYLPDGKTASDLPFVGTDWRIPAQGSPLLAMGKATDLPKDDA